MKLGATIAILILALVGYGATITRIINLPETTNPRADDFINVDRDTSGTRKLKLGNLLSIGTILGTKSNLTELASFTGGTNGQTLYVQGYTTIGDWGEPKAYTLNTSTNLIMATNMVAITNIAGTGKWIHPWTDGDVKAFGIKADGTTDDTTATQAAINYAITSGKTLKLPAGGLTSIVDGLVVTNSSVIEGPDNMLALSAGIVSGENRFTWKLKNSSANGWVIKYTGGQHKLKGVTIDGNKANNTVVAPALWIAMGFSSYKESVWEDIAVFNSEGDGIWSEAHSQSFLRVMSQDNGGNGIVITNGYDTALNTFYAGGNSSNGVYSVNHGSIRFDKVDAFQNRLAGFHLKNAYLGYGTKLVANNNLRDGIVLDSTTTAGNIVFSDSQFIQNNYPTDKQAVATTEASGTWSNVKATGSGTHNPWVFNGCRFFLTENNLSTKPKYLVESDASLTANFYGSIFANCVWNSNTNFYGTTNFSGAILLTAAFSSCFDDEGDKFYNSYPGGTLSVGSSLTTTTPLALAANISSDMLTLERTSLPQKMGLAVSTRDLRIREMTSANDTTFTFDSEVNPTIWLGAQGGSGSGTPRRGDIKVEPAVGTDIAGANLALSAGPGTGTGVPGNIFFATASTNVSGTTSQTQTTRAAIVGHTGNLILGTISDNTNVVLNLNTSTKVFRLSRLTGAQISGLATNDLEGSLVFNMTTGKTQTFTGGAWVDLH